MDILLTGLVLFLGLHSIRIFAENWRTQIRVLVGERVFGRVYSVLSLLGLVMVAWGFRLARNDAVWWWTPPTSMRHVTAVLMVLACVLLVAAFVPGNAIKAKLGHPLVLSVKVWALAHLLANGSRTHVLLFGAFLVWAVLCFRAARQRDRLAATLVPVNLPPAPTPVPHATAITVVAGLLTWVLFVWVLHAWIIGVKPLG